MSCGPLLPAEALNKNGYAVHQPDTNDIGVFMPPVNILIKPASSGCNLACDYCFYRDIASHREQSFEGMLSPELMEKVTAAGMEYAEHICSFAFQGGEPTLAGLDFYRQVVTIQQRYQKPQTGIRNSIQTNGILIDDEWARFLAQNRFLVGLSLDGPADLHNLNRIDPGGERTFNRVMNAVRLFRKYQVDFNILCVLTGRNARSIDRIFRFYQKEQFHWLQFIPCLDPLASEKGKKKYSLSVEDYAYFLVRVFDLWFAEFQKGSYISIRHLDNWLSIMLGEAPESCDMTGQCAVQFVVEGNGTVYPCDFYVLDHWSLGTVGEISFREMKNSGKAAEFISASKIIPGQCKECRWFPLCRNGCRRQRDENGVNIYCQAVRHFFDSRWDRMREAAMIVNQKRYENFLSNNENKRSRK